MRLSAFSYLCGVRGGKGGDKVTHRFPVSSIATYILVGRLCITFQRVW